MTLRPTFRTLVCTLLFALALPPVAHAADAEPDFTADYTKFEYRVPVRDGKKLFTVVYSPKDTSRSYPVLMIRTPYGCGPYGVDRNNVQRAAPTSDFLKAGYIFVCQDVRGRYMSEGVFVEMTPHLDVKNSKQDIDESSDTNDTVQWLLDHVKGHNGRVGLWGISYPGFYAAASLPQAHPAIKAVSPQAPIADLYRDDDSFHGGAFMLAANYSFYAAYQPQVTPTDGRHYGKDFDERNGDGYDYFLRLGNLANMAKLIGNNPLFDDTIEHDSYDAFWQRRALPVHLKNVQPAVLTVGGWFDAEDLAGPLAINRALRVGKGSPRQTLVMGPWTHGGWLGQQGHTLGRVDFGQNTSEFFQKKLLFPFFEQYLRSGADAKLPAAYVFETGTNTWRQYSAWPPAEAKPRTLYFHAGGQLSWTAPAEAAPAFDAYVSDPNRPVPFIAYAAQGMPREYMVSDQRFASTRPDVLVYETEVLDSDVTFAGPLTANLSVSTTGTDADWVVKLVDVYPADPYLLPDAPGVERLKHADSPVPLSSMGGFQQLVRANPLRARFRHGFDKPEAVVPGEVEAVQVELQDINHTFRRGHRIMVQVQSSWFPLIDRNPQTFVRIRDAKPEDFKAATQQLYRWRDQPSSLSVRVVE